METFKIPTTIITPSEREINIPSYWTYGNCFYWKIISEEDAVCACHTGYGESHIRTDKPQSAFAHKETVECTKEEFDTAFAGAMEAINKLNAEPIPA